MCWMIYGVKFATRSVDIENAIKLTAKHAPETHFCWRSLG